LKGKGEKNKRMEVRMNKIIEEGVLYEDDREDEEDNEDDHFDWQFEQSEAEELEAMLHARPIEDSDEERLLLVSEEEVSESQVFIPRAKLQAYMMNEGPNLRTRRNLVNKFTKGTDPRIRDIINFMGDEGINCP
jgi:hypothetical protein